VLDGDPAPPKVKEPPNFWPMSIRCGLMVGWIKMKLCMQVGLSPDHIVLDRDPAPPPKKGHSPPIFGPCPLWPDGQMDYDATWYGGRPQSR